MAAPTDEELLAIVADERRRSVGMDHDGELSADRQRALNYYKGEMPDVPAGPNRSKAVSTDVSDAVETLLPDLIEIFTGGDDVMAFQPRGPEDEDAAQQETDYTAFVVFSQNAGFLTLYSMFKDALLLKVGVVKFWWCDEPAEDEAFEGKSDAELAVLLQTRGEDVADLAQAEDGSWSFKLRGRPGGSAKILAVPAEDFTVGADTVRLADATYCAMRSRQRAQDLIEDGYDADLVERLPAYTASEDETLPLARDTAGEHDNGLSGGSGATPGLRMVEVVEHYVRVDGKRWKVVTGGGETVLLAREECPDVPFAAVTPYLTPHRFYGRSVADLLAEIQRIKTTITRMVLDSGYFALNQRLYVDMERVTDFTLSDVLDNRPGMPVRGRGQAGVTVLPSPGLGFDGFGALEYFSAAAEQRTGIVRNAQGLNPDTLHDTAKGAMALMGAAQKRVRLIARIFAETGLKDLFLGVHALIRSNATAAAKVRLRNKWVDVDPSQWGERNDLRIELGVGAGGRDQELAALATQNGIMQQLVALQGGAASGPFVKPDNVYAFAKRYLEKTGVKAPERYVSDPADPQNQPPPAPPAEDPAVAKAKADAMVRAQKDQLDAQANEAAAQRKHDLDLQALAAKARVDLERVRGELDLNRYQIDQELELKRQQLVTEAQMKAEQLDAQNALEAQQAAHGMALAETQQAHDVHLTNDVQLGGEPG